VRDAINDDFIPLSNNVVTILLYFLNTQALISRIQKTTLPYDLGATGDGVPGTATIMGKIKIFQTISQILGPKSYEFIDIGAGDGNMVSLALCFGAKYSVGMEIKSEQEIVFNNTFLPLIILHGVVDCVNHVSIEYGMNLVKYSSLPTLQCSTECEPRVAFAFCDGFDEADRRYLFESLIRTDSLLRVFICSGGRGKGDRLNNPNNILKVLNGFSLEGHGWSFYGVIKVNMSGSAWRKRLFVFTHM
jgi:hypothetical protein